MCPLTYTTNPLSEQFASKTKGDGACEAMEPSPECVNDKKMRGASVSTSARRPQANTIKNTIEKAEPLEKQVITVTMRAESLAAAEGEFFKTLLDRQEEARRHLNELSAPLSETPSPAPHSIIAPRRKRERKKGQAHASAQLHKVSIRLRLRWPTIVRIMKQDRSTTRAALRRTVCIASRLSNRSPRFFRDTLEQLSFQHVRRLRRVVVRYSPEGVGKRRPRLIHELFSESSESNSTSDATTARWNEAFETRVGASQSTRQSEWSSSSETTPRPKGSGRSGIDPTREGEIHHSRSECRSAGRHCFAWTQRDARDAQGSLVGREPRATPKSNDRSEPGRHCRR